MNKFLRISLVGCISACLPGFIEAARLRFILENQMETNVFACLGTHDCDPLIETAMPPHTRENIYTENFSSEITNFHLNLQTNRQTRQYSVVYNPKSKLLKLKSGDFVEDEMTYDMGKTKTPPFIIIGRKTNPHSLPRLEAYFADLFDTEQENGTNMANSAGYKPTTYLGDRGSIETRRDQNRFCSRNSSCRKDLASLSSYVGRCDHPQIHDNLNPFCHPTSSSSKPARKRCRTCS